MPLRWERWSGGEPERAALKDTRKIHRSAKLRAAVVVGEPGVGKTCLVVNDAFEAFASGTTVLAGRCDEDPIGPFQPVAEIVRWILENAAQYQVETSLSDAYPLAAATHCTTVRNRPASTARRGLEPHRIVSKRSLHCFA